ncbi:MAG: YHS domain-containing protein [Oceanospirillaceae bacterium]|nr:YHS domain-containing protein [Oceanospirillaceae bacterium]
MSMFLRKSIFIMTVALMSLNLMAAEKPIYTSNNAAVSGYDTVAYFTEGKPVKGQKSIEFKYLGVKWLFSSEANRALFVADPVKYAPQYGGHCAFAMANDNLVSADPMAFTIVNDKLYLNYSLAVKKRWSKDIAGYIVDADEYWNAL